MVRGSGYWTGVPAEGENGEEQLTAEVEEPAAWTLGM
jgi:hypothetical protein